MHALLQEFDEVDLEVSLEQLGLKKFFGPKQWPLVNPVRELATKLRKARRSRQDGGANVYLAPDLKK